LLKQISIEELFLTTLSAGINKTVSLAKNPGTDEHTRQNQNGYFLASIIIQLVTYAHHVQNNPALSLEDLVVVSKGNRNSAGSLLQVLHCLFEHGSEPVDVDPDVLLAEVPDHSATFPQPLRCTATGSLMMG
jgi:hypothetical protein